MKHFIGSGMLIILLTASLLLPALACAEPTYSVGLGFEFATGKYGTNTTTDSIYMPFILAVRPTERLDFSLEIPFVYQSSSAVVAGQYMGTQGMQGSTSTMSAMAMQSGMGMGTNASAGQINNSQSGLGDMKLKGGYVLYTEEKYVPAIRPNFYVKFPTADKDKFLGTGAFDVGFGVEFTKWFGKWFADGDVGYVIQGHSSVVNVKDYVEYYAGPGYQFTERLRGMVLLKGTTPAVEGATSQLEARVRAKYQFTEHTGIDGYLATGLTTSSPDFGMGLAVYYQF